LSAEHRKSQRYQISDRVAVLNALTGQQEGVLGNLSVDGLMLIADHPLAEEGLFQLSFLLPDGTGAARLVEVGAQCLWCDSAASTGTFWAGFKIVDVSDQDQRHIAQLLAQPAAAIS
jgi:PilZ domain